VTVVSSSNFVSTRPRRKTTFDLPDEPVKEWPQTKLLPGLFQCHVSSICASVVIPWRIEPQIGPHRGWRGRPNPSTHSLGNFRHSRSARPVRQRLHDRIPHGPGLALCVRFSVRVFQRYRLDVLTSLTQRGSFTATDFPAAKRFLDGRGISVQYPRPCRFQKTREKRSP
jgi:hypothetical protein